MKISYNWLQDLIGFDEKPQIVAELLTNGGLEVEAIEKYESVKGGLNGLVIGEVIECEKHPNADKLSITKVNIGDGIELPIVCGAPNVAKGQKVVVATVGTTLYSENGEPFEIKKSKIRGEVSEGMICAEDEIGIGNSHDGIMVLDENLVPGSEAKKHFNIYEDYIFEIGITPNRADATSHIGVARDLVALLNHHRNKDYKLILPVTPSIKKSNIELPINIRIENQNLCPRYTGITVAGIQVESSPEWMQNKIKSLGLRPINNIVDITNYVLLETGHPLHAFDYDRITSKEVVIKTVDEGYKFKTLDEVERKLSHNDLMICNDSTPMCIAGVFGGFESGVQETTTNIFIESAYFNPVSIRKTSKNHGLKTDASFRFERGADPNITVYALKRAVALISEITNGIVAGDIMDVYPEKQTNQRIELNFENIKKVIGQEIPEDTIKSILSDLEIGIVEVLTEGILVEIPTNKVDVTREIDVIEEIIRIYGFDNINVDHQLKSSLSYRNFPDKNQIYNLVADFLASKGFNEAMNNSLSKSDYYNLSEFESQNSIEILNPLSSELNILRQHLVFGLLETIKHNLNYKNENLKLFEIGKHYKKKGENVDQVRYIDEKEHLGLIVTGAEMEENWRYKEQNVDFYTLKSIIFSIFSRLNIKIEQIILKEKTKEGIFDYYLELSYKSKEIVKLGAISKDLRKYFDIKNEVFYADIEWTNLISILKDFPSQYHPISRFPVVRRDMALLVDKNTTYKTIEDLIYKTDNKLIKQVTLFDVYEGKGIDDGKKSYAVSLFIQDEEKTLTDQQIDKLVNKAFQNLARNMDVVLR
ncbi:MAG: phenylalanine--tRNA ligase subunit beta [Bacteroidales bacterium]|nr:phenylalanine--tRNA ligase subunit beta [Bacteroidales bacterium]